MDQHSKCPCGSSLTYGQCCAPCHTGEKLPPTAEALMRSRFTAYYLQNSAYLLATWDATTRPASISFANDPTRWTRLEIVGIQKGRATDSKGTVSFNAYFEQEGEKGVMGETSRFRKLAGRWFYLDGTVKDTAENALAPGRNGLCPCGSGKKFKRCCMK